MKKISRPAAYAGIAIVVLAAAVALVVRDSDAPADEANAVAVRPALTVTVTTPQELALPLTISANGNIMAWQEASIGTEANGLRLEQVRADVGDVVRRGQVLATFAADTVRAELAQSRAAFAEAEAALVEAAANARRARQLEPSGAMSAQQVQQLIVAEQTAQARLESARAVERVQRLRLAQTQVLAPDDGVISARSATVGAVLPAGEELFRLIRGGRLEWRAEVASSELARLRPGLVAQITPAGGPAIEGRLRMIAPSVDTQTRNGMVYVDLPAGSAAYAGVFARGVFEAGSARALTLPQGAVLLRDGFHYVLRVGPDGKVERTKVSVGRRAAARVEIVDGIDASARVVESGAAFLNDGDVVRVADAEPPAEGGGSAAAGAQAVAK
ncbi:efflux RND transporter periplasmic adaptor subunit [Phytopseudomonas daroniae]|uniref:efflux RND transporter periplasmic adaptor subunit n=1 Tax=Phytopseudomonas daroniae TaxID=2487519 RepID=UPI0010384CCD|nr:efflux RND transporter periplasmic adaptor subunit [Pseudomonas daroniae]TBU77314.1 efflux transporter periplasmic adaptor subunit [Pseudomonas daroniae]